ncbi:hypothetical protein Avbf_12605 [Armadillidium vulgare]|nr:hypothetical protein Avbf_12605 [Armadillidium vulgare]
MAFIAAQTGNIIQLTLSISGIFSGSIFGVFMLGICFPMSTKRGALIGIIFSCTFLIWIYIGSLKYGNRPEILPLSTKDCSHFTITNRSTDERNNASGDAITHFNGSLNISLMKEDVDDESKNEESIRYIYVSFNNMESSGTKNVNDFVLEIMFFVISSVILVILVVTNDFMVRFHKYHLYAA